MEHSHKNTDCYFFYYSTCKNGDHCSFRHEPSALGCETVCMYWQQGNCLDVHCNFRHMELKKNRKSIPCYWETQPGGCRKPHCSFMHKNARTHATDPINPLPKEWLNRPTEDTKYDGSSTESDQGRGSSEAGSFIGSPAVDPLIVKFEEESDNESVPSPVKPQPRVPYCKTYEEIRLEEIQAESAAYYSYEADDYQGEPGGGKIKTTTRKTRKICLYPKVAKEKNAQGLDFEVLTLDEIRERKRRKEQDDPETTVQSDEPSTGEFLKDAIKTLAELRAATSLRGVKRTIDDCESAPVPEKRRVRLRIAEDSSSTANVPPVRLRRSPKRFVSVGAGKSGEGRNVDKLGSAENFEGRIATRGNPIERLTCQDQESTVARRNEVEVRLCDSSTDEDQTQVETTNEDRKSVATDTTDDSTMIPSCDSLLNITDDDYLTLDMASDDILKDIDALLKEKSTV